MSEFNEGYRVRDAARLHALLGEVGDASRRKEVAYVHPTYRALIEASSFAIVATSGSGGLDASPRGDPPGFVVVEDETTLLMPERRGNHRGDTLHNLLVDPRIGLLFLIPGVGETLRVNGTAHLSVEPALLERFVMQGQAAGLRAGDRGRVRLLPVRARDPSLAAVGAAGPGRTGARAVGGHDPRSADRRGDRREDVRPRAARATAHDALLTVANEPLAIRRDQKYDARHMKTTASADDPSLTRKERTHLRILDAASRALRERGYAGVGVADVMREAGLTHGGFYAHFASREALLAAAIEHAGKNSSSRVERAVESAKDQGKAPLRAFIENYLHASHLSLSGEGCPVAALCSDMPRQRAEVREASSARVRGMIAAVEAKLPAHVSAEHAPLLAGALIGTLQMARAIGSVDEGRALLSSARRALISQYDL